MVAKLVSKWRRYKFLNEKDRKRLLMGLNCMRMSCDNTFIMDENSRHGPKLDELLLFLNEVLETPGEKVVIFSQWERMTRLVAEQLDANKIGYQYLHGGVPSVKRKDLLIHFREDPNCRIFLSTDAGGVGLNLQSASTVVNLDLPWNPAVLEQRIGRVHRLGQHKPVNVINFVSSGTIEEGMLSTLKFKQSIFNGVLDGGDNEVFMSESRFAKFMNTVATVTEETEKASTEHESATETKEETQSDEAAQASDIESTSTSGVTPTTPEKTVQDLFVSGIQFLEKLGSALQPSSGKSGNAPLLAELIQQDKDTGQTYLKLPVPDAETTRKISGLLESLLSVFKK
jgi:superfamily II DNA/RNA helicase